MDGALEMYDYIKSQIAEKKNMSIDDFDNFANEFATKLHSENKMMTQEILDTLQSIVKNDATIASKLGEDFINHIKRIWG